MGEGGGGDEVLIPVIHLWNCNHMDSFGNIMININVTMPVSLSLVSMSAYLYSATIIYSMYFDRHAHCVN